MHLLTMQMHNYPKPSDNISDVRFTKEHTGNCYCCNSVNLITNALNQSDHIKRLLLYFKKLVINVCINDMW